MKTFAEILKEKRKEAKLSRRELAEMCDITADSIRYWENERTTPTMFGLIALADAFNCSLDELVGRNVEAVKQRDKNLKLVWMQDGAGIFCELLFDKLQPTEKGDKYVLLFKADCEEIMRTALGKVRSEVENG